MDTKIRCWTCVGNGRLSDGELCPDCHGSGVRRETK